MYVHNVYSVGLTQMIGYVNAGVSGLVICRHYLVDRAWIILIIRRPKVFKIFA